MKLVVGLGNPGPEYRQTRHNLGHRVVDVLAERLQGRFRVRGPATVAEVVWQGTALFLAKPFAYMNVVGPAVTRLLRILETDHDKLGHSFLLVGSVFRHSRSGCARGCARPPPADPLLGRVGTGRVRVVAPVREAATGSRRGQCPDRLPMDRPPQRPRPGHRHG